MRVLEPTLIVEYSIHGLRRWETGELLFYLNIDSLSIFNAIDIQEKKQFESSGGISRCQLTMKGPQFRALFTHCPFRINKGVVCFESKEIVEPQIHHSSRMPEVNIEIIGAKSYSATQLFLDKFKDETLKQILNDSYVLTYVNFISDKLVEQTSLGPSYFHYVHILGKKGFVHHNIDKFRKLKVNTKHQLMKIISQDDPSTKIAHLNSFIRADTDECSKMCELIHDYIGAVNISEVQFPLIEHSNNIGEATKKFKKKFPVKVLFELVNKILQNNNAIKHLTALIPHIDFSYNSSTVSLNTKIGTITAITNSNLTTNTINTVGKGISQTVKISNFSVFSVNGSTSTHSTWKKK